MGFPGIGKLTITCRSCGHSAPPAVRCSNCGDRLIPLTSRTLLRAGAVLLLMLGLMAVFHGINRRPRRLIAIGDIKPYMNFRKVRVDGELVKPARLLPSGSVLYVLNDGTGQLAVFAPVPENRIFYAAGTRLRAVGSLRAGAGHNIRLQASRVEPIDVPDAAFWSEVRLADIRADKAGDTVTVYGRVSKVWKPEAGSKAPHKVVLEDPGGRLAVIHWLDDPPGLKPGDVVEVTGRVQVYDGAVELRVYDESSIQLQGVPEVPPVELSIGDITPAMEDRRIIAEGVLGVPRSIPGGVVYPLADATGEVALLLWDKQVSGEERDMLDEGVRVRVEAPVHVFQGQLELVPKDVGGFQVLD